MKEKGIIALLVIMVGAIVLFLVVASTLDDKEVSRDESQFEKYLDLANDVKDKVTEADEYVYDNDPVRVAKYEELHKDSENQIAVDKAIENGMEFNTREEYSSDTSEYATEDIEYANMEVYNNILFRLQLKVISHDPEYTYETFEEQFGAYCTENMLIKVKNIYDGELEMLMEGMEYLADAELLEFGDYHDVWVGAPLDNLPTISREKYIEGLLKENVEKYITGEGIVYSPIVVEGANISAITRGANSISYVCIILGNDGRVVDFSIESSMDG